MEHEAKYAWIGALSVLIVLALAGFIYWFALSNAPVATNAYNIIFKGTVSGLETGTDVRFNGIKVGQVDGVAIDPTDPGRVIAHVRVKASTPVRTDTKALLDFQGLTGVGYVQLTGGTANARPLLPGANQTVPSILAGKSDYQSIIDGVRTTIVGASQAFDRLDTFLNDNESKVSDTLSNTQKFSEALAANADELKASLASISAAGKEIAPLATELQKLSSNLQVVVAAVPPAKVTSIINNVADFSDGLAANRTQLDKLVADASTAAANAATMSEGLKNSAQTISAVTAQIDPQKFNASLLDFERFAAVLGKNSENVSTILKNTSALTDSLANSSGKLDTLLSNANGLVTANRPGIDKFVTDASAAATNIAAISEGLKEPTSVLSKVSKGIDPDKVNAAVLDFERFAAVLGDNSDNMSSTLENVATVSSSLKATIAELDAVLVNVNGMVTTNRPDIDKFVASASSAAANVAALAENLKGPADVLAKTAAGIDPDKVNGAVLNFERFAAVLGDNSDNVSQTLQNAASLSKSLNVSADKLDTVLANVNDMVTSKEGKSLFTELAATSTSIRKLADSLNASVPGITTGLSGFTGKGLPQYAALAADARATLARLDKVLSNIERNPQSLVFGGGAGVRTYNKR